MGDNTFLCINTIRRVMGKTGINAYHNGPSLNKSEYYYIIPLKLGFSEQ
jgi:hypothetical protein